MDWLHWVGREYYTRKSFIKEAERYGVTRRVSLQVAKQMSWGDRVFCAILDGKKGEIFGYFDIDRISGISESGATTLGTSISIKQTEEGGHEIIRSCGEYCTKDTYEVTISLISVAGALEDAKKIGMDIGKPMVGGTFNQLEPIKLMDIPFRQGFRKINGKALLHSAECNGRRVQGQFYPDKEEAEPLLTQSMRESGLLQVLENYKKKVIGETAMLQLLLF